MAEEDELFTEADILKADIALSDFVDRVKDATGKGNARAVHVAVRDVVLAMNEMNARTRMIETLERDELGELIDAVVRATGFTFPDDEDLAAEWREW